jgi:hypothetical protein
MSKEQKYIMFRKLPDDFKDSTYTINVKYRIMLEDRQYYYLGGKKIDKAFEGYYYIIGDIHRPISR